MYQLIQIRGLHFFTCFPIFIKGRIVEFSVFENLLFVKNKLDFNCNPILTVPKLLYSNILYSNILYSTGMKRKVL
jgi:hypothetical protein